MKYAYDLIMFTGGADTGKEIMKAAADHLTPCILELGGKSPCIVDEDADLDKTIASIVTGKFMNTG